MGDRIHCPLHLLNIKLTKYNLYVIKTLIEWNKTVNTTARRQFSSTGSSVGVKNVGEKLKKTFENVNKF